MTINKLPSSSFLNEKTFAELKKNTKIAIENNKLDGKFDRIINLFSKDIKQTFIVKDNFELCYKIMSLMMKTVEDQVLSSEMARKVLEQFKKNNVLRSISQNQKNRQKVKIICKDNKEVFLIKIF